MINGQKMWTTLAHEADYVLLLTRTNPDVPKHRGLTMFVVPLDTPGIEIHPVHTMGTERSNATFYDDVRIGDDRWRIGEVDGGWTVMKSALKFERGIAGRPVPLRHPDRPGGRLRQHAPSIRRHTGDRRPRRSASGWCDR